MTKDEEKLQKFLDCTDSKKARTILESLDDWILAGLVIWQEVNKTQKNWISKKLSKDPMEMFLKYWENKKIKKNSILTKTGHFAKFSKPEIQVTKANCTCRGHEMDDVYEPVNKDTLQYVKKNPWGSRPRERSFKHSNLDYRLVKQISNDTKVKKCTGGVERGNIRLSIRLVNPAKPYYIGRDWESGRPASGYHLKVSKVTYYYCVHCSSEYISSETRYSLIKKWWPKALESEKKVEDAQIKEQKEKEAVKERKKEEKQKKQILGPLNYLADIFLKNSDSKMKKMGTSMKKGELSNDILGEVLWTYMFHEEAIVRTSAKTVFLTMTPKAASSYVKKNWSAKDRNPVSGNLKDNSKKSSLYKLVTKLDQTSVNLVNPLVRTLSSGVWSNYDQRGNHYAGTLALGEFGEQAVVPLIKLLENGNLYAAEALGNIGDSRAIEPILKSSRDTSSYVSLGARGPSIALGKIGEPAVKPLIKALKDDKAIDKKRWKWDVRYTAARSLGEIGDVRAIEPLIEALGGKIDDRYAEHRSVYRNAVKALTKLKWEPPTDELLAIHLCAEEKYKKCGKLGDVAVEPLLDALIRGPRNNTLDIMNALGEIGGVRVVEPLIKELTNPKSLDGDGVAAIDKDFILSVRESICKSLIKIGKPVIIPLNEVLVRTDEFHNFKPKYQNRDFEVLIQSIPSTVIETLQKIARKNLKGDEKKNVLKFLKSDDPAMVLMGASMLKGILE